MSHSHENADGLTRALEAELAQRRLTGQRDRDKYRLIRTLSFSFLSLVILGSLIAFYFVLSRVNETRDQRAVVSPAPSAPTSATPQRERR